MEGKNLKQRSFFDNLKKTTNLKYKKVSDLIVDEEYQIIKSEMKETKFGKAVQLTVIDGDDNESVFFLPKRYSNVRDKDVKLFIGWMIVYKGKDDKMDLIDFIEPDEED